MNNGLSLIGFEGSSRSSGIGFSRYTCRYHMPDPLTVDQRHKCMSAIGGKDTTPERVVRSILHRKGCRFALHRKDLPGKPDIVMPSRNLIVLVHGCFWHMHNCRRGRSTPASNAKFWREKRLATKARDRRTLAALRRAGWRVVVVWECETRDTGRLSRRLSRLIQQRESAADLRKSKTCCAS